jgi:hypothetical protein
MTTEINHFNYEENYFYTAKTVLISAVALSISELVIVTLAAAAILPPGLSIVGGSIAIAYLVLSIFYLNYLNLQSESPLNAGELEAPPRAQEYKKKFKRAPLIEYGPEFSKILDIRTRVTQEDLDKFVNCPLEEDETVPFISYARGVRFYYGNCDEDNIDGESDLGWGCAWRAIQTCSSTYNLNPTFKSLVRSFKQTDQPNEWAEPGYGKRYFEARSRRSQIYFFKKGPSTKTPEGETLRDFSDLTDKMYRHFQIHHTPIMADDGNLAFAILGIKITSKNKVVLWIADPHKTDRKSGLYCLILKEEDGKISVQTTGIDNRTATSLGNGLNTATAINPNKGWMLLFPHQTAS